jgi:hypothetical protein
MSLLEIASRLDRHRDLLDEAEAFGNSALICFERGDPIHIPQANELALAIEFAPGGDIGWQIIDVAIILTKHAHHLTPPVTKKLEEILLSSLDAWKDREFGRGNVNHPIIATWLYAAAGTALGRPDLSLIAEDRLHGFIQIFSQVGDMSEYNSPTYLGPTLVGLANLGTFAALESTRKRARWIEERIWINIMARWHSPTQQLAGPHSRAYADSTLGFGSIFRYLAHAVMDQPVFWDRKLSKDYDHFYEAEWASKIAASTFCVPDYVRFIGEKKPYPFTIQSTTDGEDYTVDGREVYRGGRGSLTTHLTSRYCLGSAERPYVDGGQTENCIAYWQFDHPVHQISDLRSLYFRYVANERLPGEVNTYTAWYGGREMTYSPNLLHQDGRQHVLQHGGKAILLAQPLRRENGHLFSLRFDMLLPLFSPIDEIWSGSQKLDEFPARVGWEFPITIRDKDIFLGVRALEPTDLGIEQPAIKIHQANQHLILSIYNFKDCEPKFFPPHILDHTHNGLILEIGTAAEFGDFETFRDHIANTKISEKVWLGEIRQITYSSFPDEMILHYNPVTQEVLYREVNQLEVHDEDFNCPYVIQNTSGHIQIEKVILDTDSGIPAVLVHIPSQQQVIALFLSDQPTSVHLATPAGILECDSFSPGRIEIKMGTTPEINVETLKQDTPIFIHGVHAMGKTIRNGEETTARWNSTLESWVI